MVASGRLEDAIAAYNEYHSPMATAELATIRDDGFVVRFEGPFCRMCCDYDYFEDLIYELPDHGIDESTVDIATIDYEGEESFRVEYARLP